MFNPEVDGVVEMCLEIPLPFRLRGRGSLGEAIPKSAETANHVITACRLAGRTSVAKVEVARCVCPLNNCCGIEVLTQYVSA